ncbi:MAG: hypothetical protein ACYCV4_16935 [Dermatophilaceae bacterium]
METPGTPANLLHPYARSDTKAGPQPLTKAPRRIRAEDYASIAGQEAFGSAVLGLLHPLRRRAAEALRSEVELLVGDFRFASLMERVALPPEHLDPDRERQRQALELHRIISAGDERIPGLLPQLLATQNDPPTHEHLYGEAIASLDRMLAAVSRHRQTRPSYATGLRRRRTGGTGPSG